MAEEILSFEGVGFRYSDPSGREETAALQDFNLSLMVGESVAVVGESGSGKTTLSRLAAGILRGGDGVIRLDGKDFDRFTRRDWREMRREVQLVLQSPSAAIRPRMKIGAFLREPFLCYRLCPRGEVERETARLLERVGLPESVKSRRPGELSGGELQRVMIARALAVKPRLLICDEPTSALDPAVQGEVAALLKQAQRETGAAMLLITHDLALASRMADRVVVLYQGNTLEVLPAGDLKNALHPYTRALLGAIFTLSGGGEPPAKGEPYSGQSLCPYFGRCPQREESCRTKGKVLLTVAEEHLSACWKNI